MKRFLSTMTVLSAGLLFATGAAAAEKKYDEGASDTEVKLGQTMLPTAAPLSIHGIQGRTEVAYFRMLNEEKGGINGRKINLISLDDAFSPPKTRRANPQTGGDDDGASSANCSDHPELRLNRPCRNI